MNRYVVGLGANLGSRWALQRAALVRMAAWPDTTVEAIARPRRTPALVLPGEAPGPDYLNGAVRLRSALGPEALLDLCLDLERELGRVRERRWAARTLDLDLLWWDGPPVATERLSLPHRGLSDRPFAQAGVADARGGPPVDAPPFAIAPQVFPSQVLAPGGLRTARAWDDADALAVALGAAAPIGPFEPLSAPTPAAFAEAAAGRPVVIFALDGDVRGAVAPASPSAPRWALQALGDGECAVRLVE